MDCCAAPGSKTAAIAARNPDAAIIAVELHDHRAELLKRRVRAANVQVVTADALQLTLQGGFDRVLADVPCSGTGTLARNPEIKWRLKPDDLNDLHAKQVALLRAALQQLAPEGRAVYSTCSLEPEENQAVVEEVLQEDSRLTLLDCRAELETLESKGELASEDLGSLLDGKYLRTIPGVNPCDGFFAAIITRLNLLIRLTQQAPICSVEQCPSRRFPKRCGSFKATSPLRKPASSTWRPAAGPMASSAPDADIGARTNWLNQRRWQCAGCRHQVSLTAGTVLHRTKIPLTHWFWTAYLMTTDKRGVSALLIHGSSVCPVTRPLG